MAKTLAQGRKPGSGRKPGKAKTLAQGRKPGSGRKRRDTVSGEVTPTSAIPIPGAERPLTSRDLEAVDALRELTYSPQFSPPTLPPIVPGQLNDSGAMLGVHAPGMPTPAHSRSFPAISRILSASPPPTPLPPQLQVGLPGQIHSPTTPSPFSLQSPTHQAQFPTSIMSPTSQTQFPANLISPSNPAQLPSGIISPSHQSQFKSTIISPSHQSQFQSTVISPPHQAQFPPTVISPPQQAQFHSTTLSPTMSGTPHSHQGPLPFQLLSPPLPPIHIRPPNSDTAAPVNYIPQSSGVYLPSLPLSMVDQQSKLNSKSKSQTPPPPPSRRQSPF